MCKVKLYTFTHTKNAIEILVNSKGLTCLYQAREKRPPQQRYLKNTNLPVEYS